MPEEKKFLDFTGLQLYDTNIKQYIATQLSLVTPETATDADLDEILGRYSWEFISANVTPYSGLPVGISYLLKRTFDQDTEYVLVEGNINEFEAISVTVNDQNQVVSRGAVIPDLVISIEPTEIPQDYEIIEMEGGWHDWRYETTVIIEDDFGEITLTGYAHIDHIE